MTGVQNAQTKRPAGTRPYTVMSSIALALAIIALLVTVVHGRLALFLALVALVLGVISWASTKHRRLPVAASVLAIVAVPLAVASTVVAAAVGSAASGFSSIVASVEADPPDIGSLLGLPDHLAGLKQLSGLAGALGSPGTANPARANPAREAPRALPPLPPLRKSHVAKPATGQAQPSSSPTPTPTPTATLDAATVALLDQVYGTFTAFEQSGEGDDSVALAEGTRAALLTVDVEGDDPFVLWAVDANGEPVLDALVAVDGAYSGQVALNVDGATDGIVGLAVATDNQWTVRIEPASSIFPVIPAADYLGDHVFLIQPGTQLDFSYPGDETFEVRAVTIDDDATIGEPADVDEGPAPTVVASGQLTLVLVTADGEWSVE